MPQPHHPSPAAGPAAATEDEVRSFIVETFLFGNSDGIEDGTPLLESHIVDSTGILEIVTFLEERYGLRIEDHELTSDNLNSVGNISRFIAAKRTPAA